MKKNELTKEMTEQEVKEALETWFDEEIEKEMNFWQKEDAKIAWSTSIGYLGMSFTTFNIVKLISNYVETRGNSEDRTIEVKVSKLSKRVKDILPTYVPEIKEGIYVIDTKTDDIDTYVKGMPYLNDINLIYAAAHYVNTYKRKGSNWWELKGDRDGYRRNCGTYEHRLYNVENDKFIYKAIDRINIISSEYKEICRLLDSGHILIFDEDYGDIINRKEGIKTYVLDTSKKTNRKGDDYFGEYKEVIFDDPYTLLSKIEENYPVMQHKEYYAVVIDLLNKIGYGEVFWDKSHRWSIENFAKQASIQNKSTYTSMSEKELDKFIGITFVDNPTLKLLEADSKIKGLYATVVGETKAQAIDAAKLIYEKLRKNRDNYFMRYFEFNIKFGGILLGKSNDIYCKPDSKDFFVIPYDGDDDEIEAIESANIISSFIESMNSKDNDAYFVICANKKSIDLLMSISEHLKYQITDGNLLVKTKNEEEILKATLSQMKLSSTNNDISKDIEQYIKESFKNGIVDTKLLENNIKRQLSLNNKLEVKSDEERKETSEDLMNSMIGLPKFKEQVTDFRYLAKYYGNKSNLEAREGKNFHMLFLGNPGTGKTVSARLMAKLLYEAGILPMDKFVETSRSELVGLFVGHTAQKVKEVVRRALGGVLFIDEAYSLFQGERDTFGMEAIATLVKEMEDHRNELVVIMAGYEKEMRAFLSANSGLKSRVGYTFYFEDYTTEELTQIYYLKADKENLIVSKEAKKSIETVMQAFAGTKDFGNGRFVEKVLQYSINKLSNRVAKNNIKENRNILTIEDIPTIQELIDANPDKNALINTNEESEETRWVKAVHEAGHAVISAIVGRGIANKISIKGKANGLGGFVAMGEDTKPIGSRNYDYFKGELITLLAGKNAEIAVVGSHSSGCSMDIKMAKQLAKEMVELYAMPSLGADPKAILMVAEADSFDLCYENKKVINKLAKLLFKKQELNKEEIEKFFQKNELISIEFA